MLWVPVVGSVMGCILVVLVAATEFPTDPWIVYAIVGVSLVISFQRSFPVPPM